MIAWFARNHVAANLLMASILLAGFYALFNKIPLEVFPAFEMDMVNVSVALPGATPEDVEQGIVTRVEEAVADLEGLGQIVGRAREGSAIISIEVDSGYNSRELLADIKARVDAINTFPAEAERPLTRLVQRNFDVISVAVAGNLSEREIRELAEQVRDDLLRLPGVTQVELDAVRNYEIAIELSQHTLREHKLTLSEVAQALRDSSLDLSAGNIRTVGGDVLIRSKGQAYRGDEFAGMVVKTRADGSQLRLGDIATIIDGFDETPLITRFNGRRAALVEVYRVGEQSAIAVADQVKDYIRKRQASLPLGVEMTYWDDDSRVVRDRLTSLGTNALQGAILVVLLLTLFLRPAIALWVSVGIPVTFMGAFLAMWALDVSINIVSLFGFVLVLGIVVDDAIVTGENIYSHLRRAENGLQAAIQGTREVAVPVTFGVLTTVAAFMPLAFMNDGRGMMFGAIPVVVVPVLLFSLIESKLVLPAHLKNIRLPGDHNRASGLSAWQQRFADGFEAAVLRHYRPALVLALRHRYATLALFVGILIVILAMFASGWTRFVFFPPVQSETAVARLLMPVGTAFEVTDRHVQRMTEVARDLQENYRDADTGKSLIINILSSTGSAGFGEYGAHTGRVRLELQPPEQRVEDITGTALVREWRQAIGEIPGAETLTYRAEIGRPNDPIDVQLSAGSLSLLQQVAEEVKEVKARLATYPGVFEIADSMSDGKQELQVELTDEGRVLGLTRSDVIRQVRGAYHGTEVQRIQRGRDELRVMVRLPLSERRAVNNLNGLEITTPNGAIVPLSHVARLDAGRGPATITRIDRYRTVNVTADIDKQTTNMAVLQADLRQFLDQLMLQHPGVRYSLEGEAREQEESMTSLAWGLGIVLFTIYCLLAIPFRSYLQPLIVMSVIPFGVIGAFIGHWIMGLDLSLTSLLGLMALVGVVVNDSLVLVDFINQHRRRYQNLNEALLIAGVARFRPVMLTSLTTFIGLAPLLFEKSTQAQFLIPMAVSLGFGILFATFITLFLVPVNYRIAADVREGLTRSRAALLMTFKVRLRFL